MERIIGFWLVTSFRPRTVQFVSSPFMIDKCPLCLGLNCKAAEYMTTASVCWLQNGIFCPWQQGHTFVWLFGGEGCTPPPLCCCWNGHFVFVYLMWAVKLQARDKGNCPMEQQQQLSVCLPIHVFMVHQPPDANCVAEMCVFCVDLGKFGPRSTSWHLEMPGMSVIHACVWHVGEWDWGFAQRNNMQILTPGRWSFS